MDLAIGKLLDVSGKEVGGTAFAISSSRALTAFHCVGIRYTGKVKQKKVLLEFLDGTRIVGEYMTGSETLDYAILLLQNELPSNLEPVKLFNHARTHEYYRCIGYPSTFEQLNASERPDFTTIAGRVTSVDSSIFKGVPAIQLHCEESAKGLSLRGMSGAPVLVGTPEGAIGLARWNPTQKNNPNLSIGGIFFSCPIEVIVQKNPELLDSVMKRSDIKEEPMVHRSSVNFARNNLPFRPYTFLGRQEQSEQLHKLLALEDKYSPSARIPWVAIKGPRGIGKTYFVCNYAWDHLEDFETISWVNSAGENITASIAGLAIDPFKLDKKLIENKSTAEVAEAVKERLSSGGPHLIVFDNVDHPGSYVDFIPAGAWLYVLVTTRRDDLSEIDKTIKLEPLTDAEALSLMRGDAQWSSEDEQAASKLIERFNRITYPLALAGILMRTPNWWPSKLIKEIDQKGIFEWWLETKLPFDKRYQSDPKLFDLFDAFLKLLKPNNSIDILAERVLLVGGWLASSPIPMMFFKDMITDSSLETDYDFVLLENAISQLVDLGLARVERCQFVRFDGLIADRACITGGAKTRNDTIDMLAGAARNLPLNSFILPHPELGGLTLAELEPHLLNAFDLLEAPMTSERSWIPMRLAESLEADGDPSKAHQILERAAKIATDKLWKARFEAQRGRLLVENKQHEEAKQYLELAFTILHDELEPCDPEASLTIVKLAESLDELGQADDALSLLDTICLNCANLGQPSTGGAFICKAAAELMIEQDRIEDALLRLIQAIAMDTGFAPVPNWIHDPPARIFVEVYSEYALTADADSIIKLGKFAREVFGANPNRAIVMAHHQAGLRLNETGRYADALIHLEFALTGAEQLYGHDGLNTAATHQQLGETLLHLGRAEDAIEHLEQALSVAELVFEPGSKEIERTRHLLNGARSG